MPDLRIHVTIVAETAVSVGAGGSTGSIADRVIVRDALGRPLIPGSQVKGKVRHAAEAILAGLGLPVPAHFDDETDTLIRHVFGSPQHPSPLRFADLVCDLPAAQARQPGLTSLRPSVALNRRRNVAEEERLLLIEAAREGLEFTSEQAITGQLDTLHEVALLWAALRLNRRWGGAKARGLGWATVEPQLFWKGQALSEQELTAAFRQIKQPEVGQ